MQVFLISNPVLTFRQSNMVTFCRCCFSIIPIYINKIKICMFASMRFEKIKLWLAVLGKPVA